MSEVTWTLHCDCECGASVVAKGVTDEQTVRRVRVLARDLGWRCDERGDFCKACLEAGLDDPHRWNGSANGVHR